MKTVGNSITVARLVAVIAALGIATWAGPSIANGASAATVQTTAPATCSTANLVVWLNDQPNGAAGSIYYSLEFTNLGPASCTLEGYPGVSAVNLSGKQVGSAATRSATVGSKLISLRRGATASASLRIVEAGNYPNSRCGITTAAGLRVYPPNQTSSKIVPFPFSACSKTVANILGIDAMQKGNQAN